MRRTLLGLISITLIVVGLGILFFYKNDVKGSMCWRIGLVLGAIWLAFPQVDELSKRMPRWLLAVIGLSIVILATSSKAFIILAPVIAAICVVQFIGWMFKPPVKKTKKK